MNPLSIGPGTQVTLHFSLKLEDGSIVDSNFDAKPATFVVGDENLLVGFEKLLIGLNSGHKDSFTVPPEDAFGQRNPNNIQELKREDFADDVELSEGLVVSFADANKQELPGVVSEFNDDIVVVDFNHPLAGRNIIFDVEILSVEPAITH
ncbi:FKBP-type peptidyl-prolyl cis-trans isomerase [Aurantivibrio infirmus]